MPFKIYELFISGIFHLIISDYGWLHVNETMEIEMIRGTRYIVVVSTRV
jgi:hypothetical protein